MSNELFNRVGEFAKEHTKGIAAVVLAGTGLILTRRWMAGGVCRSKARLDGKTALITGSNTGIGMETAVDLARRGARVILACRDMGRANRAADQVRKRSGNKNVVVKQLDLASLQSVRALAAEVNASEERLDILINNAGIVMNPKGRTVDGFEMQFGVNHLGHFLLTNSLLDLLKKSAPSRVVTVSSMGHEHGVMNFDNLNLDGDSDPWKSYTQSKLANVLFSRELAKRLTGSGVTTYSLHPGLVNTEIFRYTQPNFPLWLTIIFKPIMLLSKTPWEGAQTTIYCAVDESLQNTSGLYYSDCAPKQAALKACDDAAAKKLWDISASMVGLA